MAVNQQMQFNPNQMQGYGKRKPNGQGLNFGGFGNFKFKTQAGQQQQPGQTAPTGQMQAQPAAPTQPTGPVLLAPGTALSKNNLSPYLGAAGRVKINPYTGETIAKDDRKKPLGFMTDQLVSSPALQEAQNFDFQDLPANLGTPAAEGLLATGQNLIGQGGDYLSQGNQITQGAVQNLLGTQGQVQNYTGSAAFEREKQLAELDKLQRQALSPNLDPEQRQMFQDMADQRRAEVENIGTDLVDLFNRTGASDNAQLAAKGIIDSTTASNTMGRREADLGIAYNQLLSNANEKSRADLLNERNRIGETASQFGNLRSLQAQSQGDLLNSLLGQSGQIGQNIGGLGVAQQGIGADLSQAGLSGMQSGGQLGLDARGQMADEQLAALGQRLLGSQVGLQNIQSLLNSKLGRKGTKQQMDYLASLMGGQDSGFLSWMDPLNVM